MNTEPIHSRGLGRSGPKRKTGCLTCRRRKVRCDEKKPVCNNCIRLRLDCFYSDRRHLMQGSVSSTSPEQSRPPSNPVTPVSITQHFNTTATTAVQQSIPVSNWTPVPQDGGWRFDSDITSAFAASPFQDIFLSSIDNFDPSCGISYDSAPWNQEISSVPSDITTEVDSVQAATIPATATNADPPPARDEERTRVLLDHFVKSANPISVILPTDTEWTSACRSLLAMAKQCEALLSAICALSALHLFMTDHHETLYEAFQFYRASSKEVDMLFDDPEIDSSTLKGAFATLFLLSRVELMAQTNSEAKAYNWPLNHLQNAHHRVHQHSDHIQSWRGISKRLLTWTTLLQTKAEYNAGITALENSSEPLTHSTGDPFARTGNSQTKNGDGPPKHENGDGDTEDDTRTIPELVYDTMNQPAFDFFLKSQAFTSRIIRLDEYHRRRGTVDTEFEILKDGQRISTDLHTLWEARPATISFLDDPTALEEALQPRMARKVLLNVRVYVANYYAQFIYLHRVAYKRYPATEDVEMAVSKIVTLARSIGEDVHRRRDAATATAAGAAVLNHHAESTRSNGTTLSSGVSDSPDERQSDTDAGLPASMLWPLFLAAIEGSKENSTWLLSQMQSMDPQGVPNASKTALLLEEVLRRQALEGVRIDHRSVRKDLFDGELSVLY